MAQVFKNLARTKRPIAVVRRSNNFEEKGFILPPIYPDPSTLTPLQTSASSSTLEITTTSITSTNPTPTTTPLTQPSPQPVSSTIVSTVLVSTTHSDPNHSISTAASAALSSPPLTNDSTPGLAATSATLSSSALTNSVTPTPVPSQTHDYRIPLIVVVCISGLFILTTAIVFIIRHLRKIRQVQTGEARSTIFGIHIPQPRPMIGGTPHEQQPSSSEKVDRSLPRPVAMGQHAQRDQQPRVSILPPQQRQHSSSQAGHLQRQLVPVGGAQDLSDHEEPPAYVP